MNIGLIHWNTRGRPSAALEQRPQHAHETRPDRAQLLEMMERKLPQHPLPLRPQPHDYQPAVAPVAGPPHEPLLRQAVDQLDRAVVLNLQPLRERADGRLLSARQPADREQQLLRRLEPRRPRRLLAESQKTADPVTKLPERPVIFDRGLSIGSYDLDRATISGHDIFPSAEVNPAAVDKRPPFR
jgi:hypothetical protein